MLTFYETCLRWKYQLKQITITWKKVTTNKKYILKIMGLKFQNPKFNILWNSILEQAKMAAQDYMLQYFKILKL